MSCSICHYIAGHDPSCHYYHEEAAQEQSELRTRLEALEQKVELKKLYGESRDYVQALMSERDDLIEANRDLVTKNNDLDAMVDKLRAAVVSVRGFMLGHAQRTKIDGDHTRTSLREVAAELEQLLVEIPHER